MVLIYWCVVRGVWLACVHGDSLPRRYTFAAKVVRGAYMVGEAERASQMGLSYPLHPTKQDTDHACVSLFRILIVFESRYLWDVAPVLRVVSFA